MTAVRVRRLVASDLDAVMAMAAESPQAPQWTRDAYERMLSADPGGNLFRIALVATWGDDLAGFAVCSCLRVGGEVESELESIVVRAAFRRRGIAAALLTELMRAAAETGATLMRLEVRAANVAATALYRAHGFTPVGRRAAYYTDPVEDARLFTAALPTGLKTAFSGPGAPA